jgi:hypothetical protein
VFLQTRGLWQVSHNLGRRRSETDYWVLSDHLGPHHPLSPKIKLGIRHPRKKDRNSDDIIKSSWDFHAVSGAFTTLLQWGCRVQRYRGGLALLTRHTY